MEELEFDIPGVNEEELLKAQAAAEKDIKKETDGLLPKPRMAIKGLSKTHRDTRGLGEITS